MVIINWKLRPKGDRVNPYVKYSGDFDRIRDGISVRLYGIQDGFSVIEVSGMLKELGYDNPNIKIHYKKPTSDLDKGLEPLLKDIDVLDFLTYVKKFKLLELFIEHPVDKCVIDESVIDVDGLDNDNVDGLESSNAGLGTHENEALDNDNVDLETDGIDNMEEELDPLFSYPNINHEKGQSSEHISSPLRDAEGSDDNEDGYENEDSDENENSDENEDSEESEDSDFEVPLEDKIDDVDVDMEMFKENTDPSVEWVGSTEPHTQAVADNNDEDVYEECDLDDFDSDIDPNDVEAERKKALSKLRKCHKPVDGHIYTENFYVSQTFPNKEIIKDMVTRISVEKIRELHLVKNDQTRVRAECRGLVPVFRLTTHIDPNVEGPTDGPSRSHGQSSGTDSLKKKTKKEGKLVVETLKCPWLMHCVKPKGENTQYCRVFRDTHTCLQSRKVRKYTTSFLAREIEQTIKPNPKIPLLALKDQLQKKYEIGSGFKAGKRDLLGLDRCFMSRPFPMQILTVVGVDLNNDDLELFRNSNFTFVTDRQKGIIPALAETFPAAEHRYCLKHIYDNMKLQWRGQLFKDLLWRCATATTMTHFNRLMEELKQTNKDVYDWLKDILPHHWARSHFSARPYCDVLLNNMCEVLNRQLLDGRDKPIITCLEFIREYLMKRIVIVQKVIGKSKGPLTPKATKILELIKKQASQQSISWNGGILYQSTGQYGEQCMVYVEDKSCSCRKWDLTGIPCKHAVAAIWNMEENGFKINPCNGPDLWPPSDSPITLTPPDYHTPIGGPPKKRKKSVAELYDNMVKDGASQSAPHMSVNPSGQSIVTQSAPVRYSKATENRYSPVKNNASRGKRKVGE
ncbi:mutator type transposase [Tanacetum coccineum]